MRLVAVTANGCTRAITTESRPRIYACVTAFLSRLFHRLHIARVVASGYRCRQPYRVFRPVGFFFFSKKKAVGRNFEIVAFSLWIFRRIQVQIEQKMMQVLRLIGVFLLLNM